jgi:prolyl-tRNA synthetase
LRPRLFLRTTEFLWQEGHTAHATEADARQFALRILRDVYEDFMVNVLAVPVLAGRKTERERFSGATTTWTCEAMMRDGKALQMGTSHELGQNFARVFDTTFLDETGAQVHVWQTSWGASTRLVGALIMAHGDDAGLRVPPRLAPVEVVVLVVRDEEGAADAARRVATELTAAGLRARLDERTDTSFGRRVVDWELKGVPVRVELGPRDLAAGQAVLVRRDDATKTPVALADLEAQIRAALGDAQTALLAEAAQRLRDRTIETDSVDEAEEASRTGFAVLPVAALGTDGESRLNAAGASVRVLTTRAGLAAAAAVDRGDGASGASGEDEAVAVVARAY